MKVLVTGATGFMGRWVIRQLLPAHDVICLSRMFDGLPNDSRLSRIRLDLSTPLDEAKLPESVDAIVHLAQSRHFREFPSEAHDIFSVNTQRTFELLEYGRRAKIHRFVFASSGGVCGFRTQPIRETDPPNPGNFYLSSKYAGECLVNAYRDFFVVANLRYFFVYGEGQRGMFVPGLVQRVLEGRPVSLAGESGLWINPIHVADAAEATVRALDLVSSDTINIGGSEIASIRSLAELIGRLTDVPPIYRYETPTAQTGQWIEASHHRKFDPPSMVAEIDKMRETLRFNPEMSLEAGVARLVQDLSRERNGISS